MLIVPSAQPGSPKILIADDDLSVLEVTRRMASLLGWQALVASTAREGLELFEQNANDLAAVLVDFNMPLMNGLEMSREVHRIRPAMRVIVMTGDQFRADDVVRDSAGHDEILAKPFQLADLERVLAAPVRAKAA